MKIFAIAYSAMILQERKSITGIGAAATKAANKDEAIGIGIKISNKVYPSIDGWYSHQATVAEIPNDWIMDGEK